jgi:hypothetical protein
LGICGSTHAPTARSIDDFKARPDKQEAADYCGCRTDPNPSQKTGKLVWIPATRELRTHLDGLTRTGALMVLTSKGKAYTRRYFNEHWRDDADKVGADDLNFHGNRGTAAPLLAEAGTTAPEIAEAMCWTVDKAQKDNRHLPGAPWRAGGERHGKARGLLGQGRRETR